MPLFSLFKFEVASYGEKEGTPQGTFVRAHFERYPRDGLNPSSFEEWRGAYEKVGVKLVRLSMGTHSRYEDTIDMMYSVDGRVFKNFVKQTHFDVVHLQDPSVVSERKKEMR